MFTLLVSSASGSVPRGNRSQHPDLENPLLQVLPKEANSPNKQYAVTVELEMEPGDEGVLISGGTYSEGYRLEVSGGRMVWIYECAFSKQLTVTVSDPVSSGLVRVRYEFGPEQPTTQGKHRIGKMYVNGRVVEHTESLAVPESDRNLLCSGFSFTGRIKRISFDELPAQ